MEGQLNFVGRGSRLGDRDGSMDLVWFSPDPFDPGPVDIGRKRVISDHSE